MKKKVCSTSCEKKCKNSLNGCIKRAIFFSSTISFPFQDLIKLIMVPGYHSQVISWLCSLVLLSFSSKERRRRKESLSIPRKEEKLNVSFSRELFESPFSQTFVEECKWFVFPKRYFKDPL